MTKKVSPYGDKKRALSLNAHKVVEDRTGKKPIFYILRNADKQATEIKTLKDLMDFFGDGL